MDKHLHFIFFTRSCSRDGERKPSFGANHRAGLSLPPPPDVSRYVCMGLVIRARCSKSAAGVETGDDDREKEGERREKAEEVGGSQGSQYIG